MHLPADSTSLTLIRSLWLRRLPGPQGHGDCRGLCRPEGGGGKEEGDKYGLVPPSLLPSHLPSLLRIPEMLGSIPGPLVSAHLVTSYFLFSSVTVAETIPVPSASHLGQ